MSPTQTWQSRPETARRLQQRHRRNRLFRHLAATGLLLAVTALVMMLGALLTASSEAFTETRIKLTVRYDRPLVDPRGDASPESLEEGDYTAVIREAALQLFPQVASRTERRELIRLFSPGAAFRLKERLTSHPELLGNSEELWLAASADADQAFKSGLTGKEGERLTPFQTHLL
ncbi:MAG: DUF3333 domain-containing protein, partial [Magnetococcales bacterium]|nr:DUF3333 domain-containing protein [Magnetococcales bacterium]